MATLKETALEVLKEKGLKAVYVSADNQIFTDKSLADLHKSTTGVAYEKIEAETVALDLAKQVSDEVTKTLTEAVANSTIANEEVKVIPIKAAKKGKEAEKVTVAPVAEEVKTVAPTEEVKTVVPAEEVK